MKKFIALFFVFILGSLSITGCATKLEKELKKASKNLTNYSMDIRYDDYILNVNQSIDYINSSETNFDKIYLHLYPNNFSKGATNKPVSALNFAKAYPNGFSEGHITINNLKVDNVEQEVVLSGTDFDILEVNVNNLLPNDRIDIDLSYEVVIPNCLHRFGYGDNTVNVANFYPIVAVYDGAWNLDPYHSNGDPFYSDVANYNVKITIPSDMVIANTGEVSSENIEGDVKHYDITANAVRDFAFVLSNKFNVASEKYQNIDIKYY